MGRGAFFFFQRSTGNFNLVGEVPRPASGISGGDNQDEYFGYSLAFNGSVLVVGAPHFTDGSAFRTGRVSVYNVSGSQVSLRRTLLLPVVANATAAQIQSAREFRGFGWSVALTGSRLAVGAPQAVGYEGDGRGSVHVLELSGVDAATPAWRSFVHNGVNLGSRFGHAVALNDSNLLIGSPGYNRQAHGEASTTNGGAVFRINNYTTAATALTDRPPVFGTAAELRMGSAVAVNTDGLFYSVPNGNGRAGFVEFRRFSSVSNLAYRLNAINTAANDSFGWAIGVSGNDVIVGAAVKNNPEANAGAAYMFTVRPP